MNREGEHGRARPYAPATLVVAAIAVRLVAALVRPEPLATDPDGYVALAAAIAEGRGFVDAATGTPTAYRPPLLPLLLVVPIAVCGPRFGVLVVQLALSGLLVLTTWWIGLRWGEKRGRTVGAIAAAVIVFDPLLVLYTLQPMTEVLFAVLAALLISTRLEVERAEREGRPTRALVLACGGVFGLAALCRPTIWAWGVLVGVVAVGRRIRSRPSSVAPGDGLVSRWGPAWLVAVLVVAPWVVRNAVVIGRPIVMTTHGGYTLLLANNPVFYDEVVRQPWGTVWEEESLLRWQQSLEDAMETVDPPVVGELDRDVWMRDRAVSNVRSDPAGFLRACLVRFGRFWNPVPLTGTLPWTLRWGVGLFNGLIFAGAVVCWCRLGVEERRRLEPALLLVASLTLVHTVYWSNARMRAPLLPVLAVLAAGTAARPTDGLANRKPLS